MAVYKFLKYFLSLLSVVRPLKWALYFLLHYSLFPYHMPTYIVGEGFNKLGDSDNAVSECAICLCNIDDDDEIRELRCDHFFHKVCLDRWNGYRGSTCPICRRPLLRPLKLGAPAVEVILLNYCSFDDSNHRETLWLR
ncbi:hypothetical protein Gotri_011370 [Gossypium trilobum]|uniref:RING-type domain-containing protein n=1 Tax=Gossypium trilobum TaxID=34281 RepID=A0A7J9ETL3_9ROSI|nr:hypothetical protein [Gossypium trilobum]